jgi:hypothetical protein
LSRPRDLIGFTPNKPVRRASVQRKETDPKKSMKYMICPIDKEEFRKIKKE